MFIDEVVVYSTDSFDPDFSLIKSHTFLNLDLVFNNLDVPSEGINLVLKVSVPGNEVNVNGKNFKVIDRVGKVSTIVGTTDTADTRRGVVSEPTTNYSAAVRGNGIIITKSFQIVDHTSVTVRNPNYYPTFDPS